MLKFSYFKKIFFALFLLISIVCIGIFGFVFLEDYTFLEALYMTVITISSVGFGEVKPLTDEGRLFTVFLIIFSFGTFGYAITSLTIYVIDGEFKRYFKNYKVDRAINKLSNHTIICGYGRNGKQAAIELKAHKRKFIIVEQDKEIIEILRNEGLYAFIEGDATLENTLEKAGIKNAKALLTTLPKDEGNVFVVLTARGLNPNLLIISRASRDNSDIKLRRAGANNVIMPDKIGGAHMASLVIKPDVMEFMDYLMGQGSGSVNLEEITFENLPQQFQNKSIKELNIHQKCGATIVGYRNPTGEYTINPSEEILLEPHSKIFVLGTTTQIDAFRDFATQKNLLTKK